MAVKPFDPMYPKTPCCTRTSRLCFIEPELSQIELLHCGNKDFGPFLFLWPWPWPDDLHIQTWPVSLEIYRMCENELAMSRRCEKLSYWITLFTINLVVINTKINKQTKLTLSSTYINRNIMVNHVSECVYKRSYQSNFTTLKIEHTDAQADRQVCIHNRNYIPRHFAGDQ